LCGRDFEVPPDRLSRRIILEPYVNPDEYGLIAIVGNMPENGVRTVRMENVFISVPMGIAGNQLRDPKILAVRLDFIDREGHLGGSSTGHCHQCDGYNSRY
jgi:hypothetical protein